jgi:hypothetical protein
VYISPNHSADSSTDEEIASINNCICELCPSTLVIGSFIADDIDFFGATEEPTCAREYNERAHDTESHIGFAAVGLPVAAELNHYYAESNKNDESEKDVVPDEECIGEPRNIKEISSNLKTTVGAAEEEQRDKHDAQSQKRPQSNLW